MLRRICECLPVSLKAATASLADNSDNYMNSDSSTSRWINSIFAVLLLIGSVTKFSPTLGARALHCIGDDVVEECTIIASAFPPQAPKLSAGKRRNEFHRLWSDCSRFGDAVIILKDSSAGIAALVPANKLTVHSGRHELEPSFMDYLQSIAPILQILLQHIIAVDIADVRPKRSHVIKENEFVRVYESQHPYVATPRDGETTVIVVDGADELIIEFDPQCRTARGDYLTFFKSEMRRDYFGEPKYFGKGAEKVWPGVGGREKLRIKGNKFVCSWNVSSKDSFDWGYKFTVRAHCKIRVEPPEYPPIPVLGALSQMKVIAYECLQSLLLNDKLNAIIRPLSDFVPGLSNAIVGAPPVTQRAVASSQRTLMFEGTHP